MLLLSLWLWVSKFLLFFNSSNPKLVSSNRNTDKIINLKKKECMLHIKINVNTNIMNNITRLAKNKYSLRNSRKLESNICIHIIRQKADSYNIINTLPNIKLNITRMYTTSNNINKSKMMLTIRKEL